MTSPFLLSSRPEWIISSTVSRTDGNEVFHGFQISVVVYGTSNMNQRKGRTRNGCGQGRFIALRDRKIGWMDIGMKIRFGMAHQARQEERGVEIPICAHLQVRDEFRSRVQRRRKTTSDVFATVVSHPFHRSSNDPNGPSLSIHPGRTDGP